MSKMDDFIKDQLHEIDIYKWIESEKYCRDLFGIAEFEWIEKYAKLFRKYWESVHGPIVEDISGNCNKSNRG